MRISGLSKDSGRWSVVSCRNRPSGLLTWLKPYFYVALLTIHPSLLTEVRADDFHFNNILIGERAAGMGGAYTAISDDPSGCYYNPAGIVFATGRSLSVSVNAFNYSLKRYKGALKGTNGEKYDWEQVSARLLPNFFGIVQPLGAGKVGFSYAVTDSTLRDQQQTFYNIKSSLAGVYIRTYAININDIDNTYNFGPSYAVKLTDNLSIGATLYAHYRDRDMIRNHLILLSNGQNAWDNYYVSNTEWGYKPIVGIMWSPADKFSIGLTASKTDIVSFNKFKPVNRNQESHLALGSDLISYKAPEDEEKREFPFTSTLGVAYFASPSFLVTGDVTFYEQMGEEEAFKIGNKTVGTVNAALGMEYYPSEGIAVRAGFYTDMANNQKLSTSKVNQPEHIDIYGGSLSLTRFTRSSSLTIGGSYAYGLGKAQVTGNNPADPHIQDAEIQNMTAFISAGYSY